MSSPECDDAMIASSAGARSKRLDPAGLDQGQQPERLDARPEGHEPIGIADRADQPAIDVDLDDVAALARLDDPAANLADEDRRHAVPRAAARARTGGQPTDREFERTDLGCWTRPRGYPVAMLGCPACRPPRRPTGWPSLHVSTHPAVLHKLAILRSTATEPKKFREVVRELSWLLGYEALADARRPTDRDRDAARADGRAASWPTGSAWCRSCAPAWAWSTRCSS